MWASRRKRNRLPARMPSPPGKLPAGSACRLRSRVLEDPLQFSKRLVMNYRYKRSAIFFAAVLILTSCSEAPKPAAAESKKEAEPPPQPSGPVSAKTAFYEMYKPARTWATDLLPLTLVSNEIPGIKNEGGKAAMWTAVFVSPSRREARTFTY